MARFGRGQPHAPLFLRAPLVVALVSAATASPVHVVSLTSERTPRPLASHVYYLRPSRTSLVPARLAPQLQVVSLAAIRVQHLAREADVLFLRNPAAPPAAAVPAPQLHLILAERRRPDPSAHVLILRNALAPVAPKPGPQLHVLLQGIERQPLSRRTSLLYVRPSLASLVPARLPPQIHIVSQVGDRTRVIREAMLLALKGPPAVVVFTPAGRPPYGATLIGSPGASVTGAPGASISGGSLDASVSGAPDAVTSGDADAELT